ncbi:DUF5723 family protein [uncultured Polaribacter sp.]|uniref:DUF5723 family protein n=1 Tax=uncultured Polaribacter sp. TaxID=174711 RepID=UPI002635CD44|nr:DUF5723 family protein [uncultured Polaribacter sp.]
MKKIFLIIILLLSLSVNAQNKQVLYDFNNLPQTLLLNPGIETNYKYHVGVPLLSGFSTEIGSTNFVPSDIFSVDNLSINDKVATVLNRLKTSDYLKLNTQIEILNAGFRYNDKTYFSFGFYQEIDAIGYYPKDVFTLANEGNGAFLNKSFDISQLLYKVDFLGVIHAGITQKISDKLTLGGRFKIYSSALNLQSTNNYGTFTTNEGNNNIYVHYLDNVNVNLQTSGLVSDNEYIDDPSTYLKNTFLGGNLGIGLDFGFTYHVNKQLQISGSLLDVGFVNHSKNIKNTVSKGSFTFEGIALDYNSNRNYWQELDTAVKQQLPTTDNQDSYVSWRPAKFNAAVKYSFGERRSKYCYDNTYKDVYTDAFGAQLYSIFRPLNQQFALTGFYGKMITNNLHTKVTYTLDNYSFSNIGVGISTQIWKINFYGIIDNLLNYSDISSLNNLSIQFGFNLIIN